MIKFKTDRLRVEFNSVNLDNRVRMLLFMIAGWADYILDSDIEITSIYRTDKEQMELYGGKMPAFGNVHGAWRAIDFVAIGRGHKIDRIMCGRIATLFNKYIQHDPNGKYPTLLFHSVGHGWHFHLQVSHMDVTKIKEFKRRQDER